MYKQTLVKVIKPIKLSTIKRLNKSKKWKYGYNKEANIVSISKNGQIGEIFASELFTKRNPHIKYTATAKIDKSGDAINDLLNHTGIAYQWDIQHFKNTKTKTIE